MFDKDHSDDWETELGLSPMVIRLENDPARITSLIHELPIKSSLFRCARSLYSTSARLPSFVFDGGNLRATGDTHGFEVETDDWDEIYLYEEPSTSDPGLALEISDTKGRGSIKLLLDREKKAQCLALSAPLQIETLDGWANIHVRKTEAPFSYSSPFTKNDPDIATLLRDIHEEADESNVTLSMVLMGETQSVWDTFCPWALHDQNRLTFGTKDRCFIIDPLCYRSFYATIRGNRRVSTFYTKGIISRFSIVEPGGVRLESISRATKPSG